MKLPWPDEVATLLKAGVTEKEEGEENLRIRRTVVSITGGPSCCFFFYFAVALIGRQSVSLDVQEEEQSYDLAV